MDTVKLDWLNVCRMWLKVNIVANIMTPDATSIQEALYIGLSNWLPSILHWQRQAYPPNWCWQLWKQAINATLVTKRASRELMQPLANWIWNPDILSEAAIEPITKTLCPIHRKQYHYNKRAVTDSYLPNRFIPVTTQNTSTHITVHISISINVLPPHQ